MPYTSSSQRSSSCGGRVATMSSKSVRHTKAMEAEGKKRVSSCAGTPDMSARAMGGGTAVSSSACALAACATRLRRTVRSCAAALAACVPSSTFSAVTHTSSVLWMAYRVQNRAGSVLALCVSGVSDPAAHATIGCSHSGAKAKAVTTPMRQGRRPSQLLKPTYMTMVVNRTGGDTKLTPSSMYARAAFTPCTSVSRTTMHTKTAA